MAYTHQEALEKKTSVISESKGYLKNDEVIITPFLQKDIDAFIEVWKRVKYTDDLCKSFSSDDQFSVQIVK